MLLMTGGKDCLGASAMNQVVEREIVEKEVKIVEEKEVIVEE
jgi:hypothetical protein